MKLQFYIAGLFASGYLALTPTPAAGAPAGHMSAALSHGNEHYRYSASYGGSSYSRYAGIYDSDYSYTPTPEQQATAKQQVEVYLAAVKTKPIANPAAVTSKRIFIAFSRGWDGKYVLHRSHLPS